MKLTLFVLSHVLLLNAYSQSRIAGPRPNRIEEARFVEINGIEQWVTIKGDSTKPVILFIHGGPGNPLSPFADAIYGTWERDFILVQWDQRGSGRSYGRNAPEELTPEYLKSNLLTIEQMVTDGIELTQYLIRRLGKQKIILVGTSWGSVLATKMAIKKPELFYAYVGHSQIVNHNAAASYAYKTVFEMAKNDNDQTSLNTLNSIGKPPYDTARNMGRLNRVIQKYQNKKSTPPPSSWFTLSPEYDNQEDNQHRSDGEDYSFVNYAGDKKFGVTSMSSTINFFKDGMNFSIPVYFIQGEEDIQTPAIITKEYFDKLNAPEKKFIIIPGAGHGFNQAVIDAQYKTIMEFILPLAKRN